MKFPALLCPLILLGLANHPNLGRTQAAELRRGPYLQAAASDAITIRWRTDLPTPSVVGYGTYSNGLAFVTNLVPTTEHIIRLTNLTPATIFNYSVGSDVEVLASGPDFQFKTAPTPGNRGPVRIWAIGDSGGFSYGMTNVVPMRDAAVNYTRNRPTDVWLTLGDNAYEDGLDEELQVNFFDIFAPILAKVTPWTTIGNHETYGANTSGWFSYLGIFSCPTNGEAGGMPSGTKRYYSFDYGNIHFICLDAMNQNRSPTGPMANWLIDDLSATTSEWIIAFWHHPPYSKGAHDSDAEIELIEMRENFLPILEAFGVDLVLGGHSHNYERSYLVHGHYGTSTTLQPGMILDQGSGREQETGAYLKHISGPLASLGTVYAVVGNSGSSEPRIGHHPAMFMEDMGVGSLILDVNTNRLDARYLRSTGETGDYFTMIKSNPSPLRFCSFAVKGGSVIAAWKSLPGRTYFVEGTASLQNPNWKLVGSAVIAVGATTSWTNSISSGVPVNYYRVIQSSQ